MIIKLLLLLSLFLAIAADVPLCQSKKGKGGKRADTDAGISMANLRKSQNFYKRHLESQGNQRAAGVHEGETLNEKIVRGALVLDDAEKLRNGKNRRRGKAADAAILRNLLEQDISKEEIMRNKRSVNSEDNYSNKLYLQERNQFEENQSEEADYISNY